MILLALGIVLFAIMIWVAASAADQQEQRERRIERDLDLKRGRHP